jgi:hypothetical protein
MLNFSSTCSRWPLFSPASSDALNLGRAEGLRDLHAVADVAGGLADDLAQDSQARVLDDDLQGADHGDAGLEQGDHLLVEEEEFGVADLPDKDLLQREILEPQALDADQFLVQVGQSRQDLVAVFRVVLVVLVVALFVDQRAFIVGHYSRSRPGNQGRRAAGTRMRPSAVW